MHGEENSFSLSNNDIEIDDYEFKTATSVGSTYSAPNTVPMSKSGGDLTSASVENDEDEDDNESSEIDVDNYSISNIPRLKFSLRFF